jgi:amidohydrolase
VAAVFGLHNNLPGPGTKIGQIAYTEGAAMAGTGTFRIRIIGKGGHAAFPHRCIDPVYIGACLVEQLQGLVSRRVDPLAQAVVSVTTFQGGTADNIIPGDVTLRGTFRALDPRLLERLKVWIIERTEAVAAAHGATAEIRCELGYPVLFNDGKAARAFREVISELGWTDRLTEVPPNMGGEDFAYYSLQVPGFFYFLPACPEEQDEVPGCHSPFFDFNDDLLPIGMRLHVETALRFARIWSKTGEA